MSDKPKETRNIPENQSPTSSSFFVLCGLCATLLFVLYTCIPTRSQLFPAIAPATPGDGFIFGISLSTQTQLRTFHGSSRPPFLTQLTWPWEHPLQPPKTILDPNTKELTSITQLLSAWPRNSEQCPNQPDICTSLPSEPPSFLQHGSAPPTLTSALSAQPTTAARALSVTHSPSTTGVPSALHGRTAAVALGLDVLQAWARVECGGRGVRAVWATADGDRSSNQRWV